MFGGIWMVGIVGSIVIAGNGAVTHWAVRDTGRIISYYVSPFDLRRPFDLVALLHQEKRVEELNTIRKELINSRSYVDQQPWVNPKTFSEGLAECYYQPYLEGQVEVNFFLTGEKRAQMPLYLDQIVESPNTQEPDCEKFDSNSDYSSIFQQFLNESESTIEIPPDDNLLTQLSITAVQMRIFLTEALKTNSTSWYHHNLASMYWRSKGDGSRAISCLSSAFKHAPKNFQDILFYNLGGLLHQAKQHHVAVGVLQQALEYNKTEPMHYYALGVVNAKLGQTKQATNFFKQFAEMKPGYIDPLVITFVHNCVKDLKNEIIKFQESIVGFYTNLLHIRHQQDQYVRLHDRILSEQTYVQLEGISAEGNSIIDSFDLTVDKKMTRCVQKTNEISCNYLQEINSDIPASLLDLDVFDKNIVMEESLNGLLGDKKVTLKKKNVLLGFEDHLVEGDVKELFFPKYPNTMPMSSNQYFDAADWPSKEECIQWDLPVEEKEDLILPVFLPPENKGFQIKKILSEQINLPEGSEHELPWHPPICERPNMFTEKYMSMNERHLLNSKLKSNSFLRNQLLQYVNFGKSDEAEIGQRIITAIEKKAAPEWVLTTLASLYWRVRRNAGRALDCLELSLKLVPDVYSDVTLDSISSIYFELGLVDHAFNLALFAHKVNYVEPSTNFLLALLHYKNNNRLSAMTYIKNVLRVDPGFYDGKAEFLLKLWSCRLKFGANYKQPETVQDPEEQDFLTCQVTRKIDGVVCSRNGDHCKTSAVQCSQSKNEMQVSLKRGSFACNLKMKSDVRHALYPTVMNAEFLRNPDGNMAKRSTLQVRFHMGIEHSNQVNLGDFYALVNVAENPANPQVVVYDNYGTYKMSPNKCSSLVTSSTSPIQAVWASLITPRITELATYLKPLEGKYDSTLRPYCPTFKFSTMDQNLMKLKIDADNTYWELIRTVTNDYDSTPEKIAVQLHYALQKVPKNSTWLVTTGSALYWLSVGDLGEALTCLNAAIEYCLKDTLDVPLSNIAVILESIGLHSDALHTAYMALNVNKNFILNHYLMGTIHVSLGEADRGLLYFRTCMALDSTFEPARYALQIILCFQLFDLHAFIKDEASCFN